MMSGKEFRVLSEDVYNRKGVHSFLGYRPLEEYERQLTEDPSQEGMMAKTVIV